MPTRDDTAHGYGRWLSHLRDADPQALALPPSERVTRERLQRYLAVLHVHASPSSVRNAIRGLHAMMRAIAPEQDWGWLGAVLRRAERDCVVRPKRPRMVDADRLLALGLGLMESRVAPDEAPSFDRALDYRDGLVITLLITRPLRLRNLTAIPRRPTSRARGRVYQLVFGRRRPRTAGRSSMSYPRG